MSDYTPPTLEEFEVRRIAEEERKLAEERTLKRIQQETAKRDTVAIEAKKAELDRTNDELGAKLLRFQKEPGKYQKECSELIAQIEANEHERDILDT